MVNYSVSAAGVSDLMTGELSVAVFGKNVVEMYEIHLVSCPDPPTHVERGSGVLSDIYIVTRWMLYLSCNEGYRCECRYPNMHNYIACSCDGCRGA